MRGINKVILVGTLGADPEYKPLTNGASMVNLSVATSDEWSDKFTGQKQQKTEWHRVVIFGKLAEIAQQYLKKGSQVYLEGKLQTRKWQDQNGQDRYSTEITLSGFDATMQMLGGPRVQPQTQSFQPETKKVSNIANNIGNNSMKAEVIPTGGFEPQPSSFRASFDDLDDDVPW